MINQNSYQSLLLPWNLIGGSGQSLVPGQTVNNIGIDSIVEYSFFTSKTNILNSSYYLSTDEEVVKFIAPDDYQQDIESSLQLIFSPSLSIDPAYVWFQDVADITFAETAVGTNDIDSSGSIDHPDEHTTGHIAIGQLDDSYSNFSGGIFTEASGISIQYNPVLFPGNPELKHGDIFFNSNSNFWNGSITIGSQKFKVLLEEVLHSLGVDVKTPAAEGTFLDNQKYTVSAYASEHAPGMWFGYTIAPHTLQILDIAALQAIYGANTSAFAGDTVYSISNMNLGNNNAFLYTIWDGNGTDTIDASGSKFGVEIDLRPGRFSSIGSDATGLFPISKDVNADPDDPDPGNVAIAYGAEIENAIGTDKDDIFRMVEGKVNSIDGRGGNDTVNYDHYTGSIDVNLSTGSDSEGNTLINVENVVLGAAGGIVIGSSNDEEIIGSELNDIITGAGGSDTLSGDGGDDLLGIGNANSNDYSTIDGGTGFDIFEYSNATNLEINGNDIILGTASVTGVESIKITSSSVTSIYVQTLNWVFDMSDAPGTASWMDYSQISGTLDFDVGSSNWVVENSTQTETDTYNNVTGVAAQFIGTSHGDTITIDHDATFWLGTGDDTLTVASGAVNLIYSEGVDIVQNASSVSELKFDASIQDSALSFSEINKGPNIDYVIGEEDFYRDYSFDLKATVTGKGSITLEDFTATIWAGSDDIFGTSDDTYSRNGANIRLWNGSQYTDEDILVGSGSFLALEGTAYDDVLTGSAADETMNGFGGNDTVSGLGGNDIIYGEGGADILNGGTGNDTLRGGLGNDDLNGGSDNDSLSGGAGNDDLDGGDGADTLIGGIGADVLNGGNGNDQLSGFSSSAATNTTDPGNTLNGGAGNDTLHGAGGADILNGDAGDDILFGHKGNDTLNGGQGHDNLYGGEGADTYVFDADFGLTTASNVVYEDVGNGLDQITFNYSVQQSNVTYWVDGPKNSLDLYLQIGSNPNDLIIINGEGSKETGTDAIQRLESVLFQSSNVWDITQGLIFDGDNTNNIINATVGNDVLNGFDGDDTLNGGDGDDILTGGVGEDRLNAGGGDDTLYFTAANSGDRNFVEGGSGDDTYIIGANPGQVFIEEFSGGGFDTLHFASGITPDDLYYYGRDEEFYLEFKNNPDNYIKIWGISNNDTYMSAGEVFEQITFEDTPSVVWDLTGGLEMLGTPGAEQILTGTPYDDVIDASSGGPDWLSGWIGDDMLIGDPNYQYGYAFYDSDPNGVVVNISISSQTEGGVTQAAGTATDGHGDTDTIVGLNSIRGSHFDDILWGNDNANTIAVWDGDDIVYGFGGNDTISMNDSSGGRPASNDTIYAGDGNDRIFADGGDDYYDGGDGSADVISFGSVDPTTALGVIVNWSQSLQNYSSVNLQANEVYDLTGGVNTTINIEALRLSTFDDVVFLGNDFNYIEGYAGDDLYILGSMHEGGTIFETSNGGTDTLLLTGGIGPDDLSIWHGGSDDIHIVTDLLSPESLRIQDGLLHFEQIAFDSGDGVLGAGDTIWNLQAPFEMNGTDDATVMYDTINDDIMYGNGGDDFLFSDKGDDTLDGGAGTDEVRYYNVSEAVYVDLELGLTDKGLDGTWDDTLVSIENAAGGAFNDELRGDDQNNYLNGQEGNNLLIGNGGDDFLVAAEGDDILIGGAGDDTLRGEGGFDQAIFSGIFSNYIVNGGSNYNVSDTTGTDGTDSTVNVEQLVFADGIYENGIFTPTSSAPPVLSNNGVNLDEDTNVVLTAAMLEATDTDNTPSELVFTLNAIPANSNLKLNGVVLVVNESFTMQDVLDGLVSFTPDSDQNGSFDFDFTLSDGTNTLASEIFAITVNPVNDIPEAQDDLFVTDEDTTISGNLLTDNGNGADSDIDGDTLSVQATTFATAVGATVIINENGLFDYTPFDNYNGTDSFNYTIIDPLGESDMATVTITVDPVNDAPIANDDAAVTGFDQVATISVLLNDSDPENGLLSVVGSNAGTNGTTAVNLDDTITYTPNASFSGVDSFTYTLEDDGGLQTTATVQVFVAPTLNVVEGDTTNNTLSGTSANDTLIGGGGNDNTNGGDGDDTYVFSVGDGFDIITDPSGNDTLLILGNITFANLVFTQINNDLQIDIASGVTIKDFYTDGTIENIVFEDGSTFDLTSLLSQNQNPDAQDDLFITDEDIAFSGNVLIDNGNGVDSDIDGDTLSVQAATFATVAGATVIINTDGLFDYTPALNFNGVDSFDYTLLDPDGASDTATVAITVNAINDIPEAQDDLFVTDENTAISGNLLADNGNGIDSDPDGDALDVVVEAVPTEHGFVAISNNGDFTYTPDANYVGVDDFSYTLNDGQGGTAVGSVNLTINAVNSDPIEVIVDNQDGIQTSRIGTWNNSSGANPYNGNSVYANANDESFQWNPNLSADGEYYIAAWWTYWTNRDTTVTYEVHHVDGVTDITVNQRDNALSGQWNNFGSFVLDQDSYVEIHHDGGTSRTSSADALRFTPETLHVNSAPTAVDDDISTIKNIAVNIDTAALLSNDSDDDGDVLSVSGVGVVVGGTALLSGSTIIYTPDSDFVGNGSFTYTIEDGNGGTDSATVNVVVSTSGDPDQTINGTNGADTLVGGTGNDTLSGLAGADILNGNAGDDMLIGGFGFDTLDGGSGNDTADFTHTTAAVDISLVSNQAVFSGGTESLISIENIIGSNGKNVITGNDGDNVLNGMGGADILRGNAGNDLLLGGFGFDTLDGGSGNDTADFTHTTAAVDISLVSNQAVFSGGAESLVSIENIVGSNGKNVIIGNDDDNIIDGANENDVLTGNNGADTFVFSLNGGLDVVTDFSTTQGDMLDVAGLLAEYDPLVDTISDFVQIIDNGPDSILSVDSNGGANGFTQIVTLVGVTGLTDEATLEISGNLIAV